MQRAVFYCKISFISFPINMKKAIHNLMMLIT